MIYYRNRKDTINYPKNIMVLISVIFFKIRTLPFHKI